MTDIATLGLAIDSREVVDASKDLDRLREASRKVEDAAGGFGRKTEEAAKRAAAANDNLAKSGERVEAVYGRMRLAVAAVAATITGAFVMGIRSAVSRLGEMERVNAQVNKALDNAGTMAGHSAESIRRWADDLEKATGRAATEVMAISANLASFGFNEDVFFRAIKLADDMAAAWGGDLRQNMEGLARALENPEKGLAMLSARGITFTAEGRKMAMQLSATGRAAEAAAVLMDELEGQVKGVAEAGFNGLTRAQANARRGMTEFFDEFVRLSGAGRAYELTLLAVAAAFEGMTGAMRAVVANIDQVAEAAGIVGVALGIAFGPVILSSAWALVAAVGTGMVTAFNALTAAMLANPMTAFATAIVVAVTAAYYFRDEIQKAIGVDVVGIAKTAANMVIGSFVAAYEDISFVWGNFGNIMGAAVIGGVNIAIQAINSLVTSAKVAMNDLIGVLNMIPGVGIGGFDITNDPIGTIDNPYAKRLGAAVEQRNAAVEAAMARDYIGELGATFKTSEQAAADFGSAVAAANQNLENTGGGGGAADKAAKAIKGVADEAAKAAQAALDFGKDLVRGFVSDLRSGLEQGKGFWRSFGDAAMNVLDKIVDKLLNNVIDALFQVNSAAGGSGGGGFLGAIFGGIGRLFGFASGGYTGAGAASQPAGIVHAGEYVFSKSAVDKIGLGYLDSLHSAAKGYMNGGYVRSHAPANLNMRGYQTGGHVQRHSGGQEVLKIELVSRFDADGGFEQAVERSSRPIAMQESAKAAGQVAKSVPKMVDQRVNTRQARNTRA